MGERPSSNVEGRIMRGPAPTIYDVARLAEVSPSTVSRALSQPGRMKPGTEERVREAAARLGYRLNPMARALPTGRTGTVALILADITNPVYFDLVRGAGQQAAAGDHTLVLAESQGSTDAELAAARRLAPSVDGIVLIGSRLSDDVLIALSSTKRLVLVNRRVGAMTAVVPDVRPGLVEGLEYLRNLGHRSIGYVAGPVTSWIGRMRFEVLFDEAVARGMNIVEIGPGTPTMEGGSESLRRVLAAGVTAVFAYNDLMALGLLEACRRQGVQVPGRLSIVGFDDIFGASLPTPALTTIRTPLFEAGQAAVRALLTDNAGVEHEDGGAGALSTRLVIRESVGRPSS